MVNGTAASTDSKVSSVSWRPPRIDSSMKSVRNGDLEVQVERLDGHVEQHVDEAQHQVTGDGQHADQQLDEGPKPDEQRARPVAEELLHAGEHVAELERAQAVLELLPDGRGVDPLQGAIQVEGLLDLGDDVCARRPAGELLPRVLEVVLDLGEEERAALVRGGARRRRTRWLRRAALQRRDGAVDRLDQRGLQRTGQPGPALARRLDVARQPLEAVLLRREQAVGRLEHVPPVEQRREELDHLLALRPEPLTKPGHETEGRIDAVDDGAHDLVPVVDDDLPGPEEHALGVDGVDHDQHGVLGPGEEIVDQARERLEQRALEEFLELVGKLPRLVGALLPARLAFLLLGLAELAVHAQQLAPLLTRAGHPRRRLGRAKRLRLVAVARKLVRSEHVDLVDRVAVGLTGGEADGLAVRHRQLERRDRPLQRRVGGVDPADQVRTRRGLDRDRSVTAGECDGPAAVELELARPGRAHEAADRGREIVGVGPGHPRLERRLRRLPAVARRAAGEQGLAGHLTELRVRLAVGRDDLPLIGGHVARAHLEQRAAQHRPPARAKAERVDGETHRARRPGPELRRLTRHDHEVLAVAAIEAESHRLVRSDLQRGPGGRPAARRPRGQDDLIDGHMGDLPPRPGPQDPWILHHLACRLDACTSGLLIHRCNLDSQCDCCV
jgi:hypothetical protein